VPLAAVVDEVAPDVQDTSATMKTPANPRRTHLMSMSHLKRRQLGDWPVGSYAAPTEAQGAFGPGSISW
jgi:hypothetical protein